MKYNGHPSQGRRQHSIGVDTKGNIITQTTVAVEVEGTQRGIDIDV
jgi:hypothetical protein